MNPIIYNITALIIIAGIVIGIKLMSSTKHALKGNTIGSICVLGAVILTLLAEEAIEYPVIWIALAIGGVIGYFLAIRVKMIQMPQLVALLNGAGGGASAIVPLVFIFGINPDFDIITRVSGCLGLYVGSFTLSGSIVAALKLSNKISHKPTELRFHTFISVLLLLASAIIIALNLFLPISFMASLYILALIISLIFGVVFSVRIGGADMPINISLLNALSGLAVSITGFAIQNPLLVAGGAIVGAAGMILTESMCKSMNRSIFPILTGETTLKEKYKRETAKEEIQTESPGVMPGKAEKEAKASEKMPKVEDVDESILKIFKNANTVVFVPGYGMALAQAHHKVRELMEKFEERGKNVAFAIHPVAGRMPGHMNVLLAEANVPYEKMIEMDNINPKLSKTDLVIVVGASDVINPAATTAKGTPIYGMPIIKAGDAKNVIIANLNNKPGYSGVENELYKKENVILLLGDAKETITNLIKKLSQI